MEELFEDTKCGRYCLSPDETDEALYDYYLRYKKSGRLTFAGDISRIDKFSYREMASAFADILEAATAC